MANEKRFICKGCDHYLVCKHAYKEREECSVYKPYTVDAVEVVHAYWIKHEYAEEENGLLVPNYECSACRSWERDESYYCPNCGAKMDGERRDNG